MDRTISVVGHATVTSFDVEHISCHNESYPIIDYRESISEAELPILQ